MILRDSQKPLCYNILSLSNKKQDLNFFNHLLNLRLPKN